MRARLRHLLLQFERRGAFVDVRARTEEECAMLKAVASFRGFGVAAKDGGFGTVCYFLVDYSTWNACWMVVEIGKRPTGRKVLLRPSSVLSVEHSKRKINVALTKAQVLQSPDIQVCHLI
jgi:hypothetical protein